MKINRLISLLSSSRGAVFKPTGEPDVGIHQMGVSREMLSDFLVKTAREQMAVSRRRQVALKTPEEWRRQQKHVRQRILESIGGLPRRTPLNSRIVGTLDRGDFRIERLIYESRPQYYVTANVYVPNRRAQGIHSEARMPAILSPCGHSADGKCADTQQHLSISLAKRGFIVLSYDPLCQGERSEYVAPGTGRHMIPKGSEQHCQSGNPCFLTGTNIAQYFIWDGIRGMDYLSDRHDVDPTRIGVTGCSGGGTVTTYLLAIDDRVAAAAPACYVTTLVHRMMSREAADAEQSLTRTLMWGIDHAEMLTPMAPKPLMILCAQHDFFPIVGTLESFNHLKMIYASFGAEEKVAMGWSDDVHGYRLPLREHAYAWFSRWLGNPNVERREPRHRIEPVKNLMCTETGKVQTDLGGLTVWSMNQSLAERIHPNRPMPTSVDDVAAFRKEICGVMPGILALPEDRLPAEIRVVGTLEREDCSIEKTVILSEPGIAVPGLLFRPLKSSGSYRAILHIDEAGKGAAVAPDGLVGHLIAQGCTVLSIDPRGMGETRSMRVGRGPRAYYGCFGTEADLTYSSFMIGRPMLGMRVLDALQALDGLLKHAHLDTECVGVAGRGYGGTIALFVAALDERVNAAAIEQSLVSYRMLTESPMYSANVAIMLPDVLKHFDLPDVVAAAVPRRLMLIDSIDHMKRPLSPDRAKALHERAVRNYGMMNHPAGLRCVCSESCLSAQDEIVTWLTALTQSSQ